METSKIFESSLVKQALKESIVKLNPTYMIKNPIMFVVEIGMLLSFVLTFIPNLFIQEHVSRIYVLSIFIILLLTLIFANFSEALAEGRGKAQANALRQTQTEMTARLIKEDGSYETIDASDLKKGDIVRVETGEQIPNDGQVIKGLATVDESAITGESAPVIKESGGDFNNVIGGTTVASDWLEIEIMSEPGQSFLNKMIHLVEGATRKKTPNEIALFTLLMTLTIIFLVVIMTMYPLAQFLHFNLSIVMLIALTVCLIPTTIGGLLSAIGIAGMDRVTQFNILAKSGRSVESCGDVNVLILDKTGTITYGNRMADAFIPVATTSYERLVRASYESVLHHLGIDGGNMEGKETRFGIGQSALFTTITTAFTTGSVNSMHDSLTPLGGIVPMVLMMLNAVFGGEGVGLMNMLIYVMLTVFICSLMIGKTPTYLGMKIESQEMKWIALTFLVHPLLILIFSALAFIVPGAKDALTNPQFHGVSQVLYEFSSSSANNGSGFEGLKDNTVFWNVSTAIVMLLARYIPIVLQLMIVSSLVNKKTYQHTQHIQDVPISNVFFSMILIIFIILLSGLTFLPDLMLGPIGEHLLLNP